MADVSGDQFDELQLELRPVGIDQWAEVRGLHRHALRQAPIQSLEANELQALIADIASPDYTNTLMSEDLWAAWLDYQLVATAGWRPSNDDGVEARITSVAVSPLFQRLGIGRRVVQAAEARAVAAGFKLLTLRAWPWSLAFFEAVGYERSSQGVRSTGLDGGAPVIYMRKGPAASITSGDRANTLARASRAHS